MIPPAPGVVTVSSPCSGCSMSIHSPTMVGGLEVTDDRAPIMRFVDAPHHGCSGNGTYKHLVAIYSVMATPAPPAPRRRWWRR